MYFWNSYPFVRFCIALILGIITFDQYPLFWNNPEVIIGSGVLLLFILVLISGKTSFYKLRHINGLIGLTVIFFLGGSFTKQKYHSHPNYHYKFINQKSIGFAGTIASPVNTRTNHFRYDFELESIKTEDSLFNASGKIHFYVRKDSSTQILEYGDRVVACGSIHSVPGPDNPGEFNYKKYLEKQNIYGHAFVKSDDFKKSSNSPPNLFFSWAYQLRSSASHIIDLNIPQTRENGIAKALLLGIKDYLDNDIKKSYSAAGAMHVLAVSGLHVGIIYLILRLLIGKLKSRGKWGKYAFGFISVLVIWFYAVLTGMSPSVLRAATMFSFVAVSQSSTREGNIYNTLGFSAFILLLLDPYLVYSVGFQLSFAAVFGIVYLQPKLYRLLNFSNLILDKAWAITCVSIAAQLATFPLSAYYFHQFPTYFLVSNLVIIPASSVILIGGILMLIISPVSAFLSALAGKGLFHFMWLINELIGYVHILPNSLIEWIYMDQLGLLLTYFIVISLVAGLHFRSFKTLIFSAVLGFTFVSYSMISNELQSQRKELIFYEIADKIAIDHINGHNAQLYVDNYQTEELELLSFQINPYRLSSHLDPIATTISKLRLTQTKGLTSIKYGEVAGRKIIIFDSTTFHLDFKEIINTNFIIVNNESIKSLKWLSSHFNFDQLIISNKNSSYYIRKMKEEALKEGVNLHALKTDGSLRISLKEDTKKERTIVPAQLNK